MENLEEARIFERITRVIGIQVGKFYLADYIPSIQLVFTMLSKNEKLLAGMEAQADAFIESIFERHQFKQVNSVSPDENSEETNFIDVLVNLANDGAEYLDQELIKLVILEALLVGTEGMCITAEWAMAELLRHPKILQKLQTELDTIVGTSRLVKESDFPNLPYFQAIMKENCRLHPAGPIMVPHESIEATKIDGYDIPAHTRVFPNVWAMGRDPTMWARPLEFDPKRFLNLTDMEKQDPKVKVGAFGSGRRQCPGMRAGSLTVGLGVAHLVQCFEWSTPGEVDVTEKFDGAGFAMLKNPLLRVYIQAPRVPISLFTM